MRAPSRLTGEAPFCKSASRMATLVANSVWCEGAPGQVFPPAEQGSARNLQKWFG